MEKKIAFISDIHGNHEALKAVLSELDRIGITEIYCAGDVVGYFCQVNEVIEELMDREIKSILGNHDYYMTSGTKCARSASANFCIDFQRVIIKGHNLAWLNSNLYTIDLLPRGEILVIHGGLNNPVDEYLDPPPTNEYFDHLIYLPKRKIITGHTHIPVISKLENCTYVNAGSVGMPRDNDPRACFVVYDVEADEFSIHRVEYDMEKLFELMDNAGFDDYYYGCLKTGAKNLCKLPQK